MSSADHKGDRMLRFNNSLARSILVTSAPIALMAGTAPAWAQATPGQAQPSAAGALAGQSVESDDIVVTAQKREERLMDVPVSVAVVRSDTLLKQNLVQLRDYYSRIPGLSLGGAGTEQRANSLAIRGLTAGGGTAATVAVTIDDVPLTSATYQAQSPLPDLDPATLQGIEVLRGPQGTLYGASSLGGLIKFVTTTPNTTQFSGRIEAGTNVAEGGDEGYSTRGSLNVPLVRDQLAVQVSGFFRRDPAYIDDVNPLVNQKDVNANKTYGGRAAIFIKPIDALTINLSALHQTSKYYGSPSIRVCAACGSGAFTTPVTFDPIYGDMTNNLAPSSRNAKFTLYQARTQLDLGFADLTSISAWSRVRSLSSIDSTTSFSFLIPVYGAATGSTTPLLNGDRTSKFTQEVRLASKPGTTLEWLLGGFYTKEHTQVRQAINLNSPTGTLISPVLDGITTAQYEEKAVFADATYHLTSRFDVQAGVRYSKNRQRSEGSTTINSTAVPIFVDPSLPDTSDFISNDPLVRSSDSATTWLVSARYRLADDTMAYARVATGYRPGGPNAVLPSIPATFGPDKVTSYEIGLKGKIASAALTYEAALFQIDWDNIQLQFVTPANIGYFTNGSTARSRGAEFSSTWRPAPGLRIDGNLTYTDAKLTADVPAQSSGAAVSGLKGDRLPNTAHFVGNLAVQKDWALGNDLSLFIGGNLSYVGPRPSQRANPGATRVGKLELPSYAMFDLNGGIAQDGWSLNLFVRNVTNKRAVLGASTNRGTSSPIAIFAQPRTYGLTVAKSF